MDNEKIAKFIKSKRKKKGLTQDELAEKLFVTEKAISRWETGRGTPDISLLIPLAKELDCEVKDILNGSESLENIISYNKLNMKTKNNIFLKLGISLYIISLLIFLFYLKIEYGVLYGSNYSLVIFLIISSFISILGYLVLSNKVIDKKDNKLLLKKANLILLFIYYFIYLLNVTVFARVPISISYNIVPFKSIIDTFTNFNLYSFLFVFLGNIIIYMPFGIFIPRIFNKINNVYKYLIVVLFISLFFELSQLIFKRGVFDIDDILLNISGCLILYFINYLIIKKKSN